MHLVNLANGGRQSDAWMRITVKARQAMRNPDMLRVEYQWVMSAAEYADRRDAERYGREPERAWHHERGLSLWDAVQAMHAEQRADGIRRGASLCDYSDCGRPGSHVWERTDKERKAMKARGSKALAVLASVCHCEEHIPSWRVSLYRPVGVRVSRETVAA